MPDPLDILESSRVVVKAGGYYGAAFTGSWGVTHGDLLSLVIFNVLVDAVVRH